jgi:hypothetical protein
MSDAGDSKKTAGEPDETHDRILVFKNPDKEGSGSKSGAPAWMPSWPFRMLCTGPPGSGKRNAALNVAVRLRPAPDRIMVLHIDPESREYRVLEKLVGKDNVHYYTPDSPPNFEEIEGGNVKTLLIVDETPTKALTVKDRTSIERLCNYGSTHKNCSILFSFQDLTNISPSIRRAFNHFVLFRGPDDAMIKLAAHRTGVPPEELQELMTLCTKSTDSIWVDSSVRPDSPWRYRLNLSQPIYMTSK